MSSYNLVANAMVLAGAVILLLALVPVRQLIAQLAGGPLRNRWAIMVALIAAFLIGYLAYLALFWERHAALVDLVVPTIFLLGGCFVWLTANLSLQTAVDVMRVSRLERETITDALTGVFNRRYLDNRLAEELARSRRYGFSLSVIFLDIDHFKHVNDSHGHPFGDKVLAGVANRISSGLRDTDVAARFGGEEFVVVTPHTESAGATDVGATPDRDHRGASVRPARMSPAACASPAAPASRHSTTRRRTPPRCSMRPTRTCTVPSDRGATESSVPTYRSRPLPPDREPACADT